MFKTKQCKGGLQPKMLQAMVDMDLSTLNDVHSLSCTLWYTFQWVKKQAEGFWCRRRK